jgi:hypothetical protein
VPWALVTGLLVLSAGGAALSVTTTSGPPGPVPGASSLPIPTTPFTGFGGYHVVEATTSIGAHWVVPTIVGTRRQVSAATWIGAQSVTTDVFVQVGVAEQWSSKGPPVYEAFWSDSPLQFVEQQIRAVKAGDTFAASMNQTSGGWVLDIGDLTQNWSQVVPTHYGGNAPFSQGEWLQEDPPPSLHAGHDLLYPQTTVVQFTAMTIDGQIPSLPFADSQALSGFGGVYLVPTSFVNDGFSLPPAQGPARQYLGDAAAFDTSLETAANSLGQQRLLSVSGRRRLDAELITAFRTLTGDLTSQSWPATVVPDIGLLARYDGAIIADDEQAEATITPSSAVARTYIEDLTRFHLVVEDIRGRLGLPPI